MASVLSAAGSNNSSANFYMQIDGQTGPAVTVQYSNSGLSSTQTIHYRTANKIGPTGAVPIAVYGQQSAGSMSVTQTNIFGLGNLQ